MADLEVVLKKVRLLLLTLSSHSHHCRSRPTAHPQHFRACGHPIVPAAVQSNALLQRERKMCKMADPDVVLKKERLLVLALSPH
jgi:hypothetical protein